MSYYHLLVSVIGIHLLSFLGNYSAYWDQIWNLVLYQNYNFCFSFQHCHQEEDISFRLANLQKNLPRNYETIELLCVVNYHYLVMNKNYDYSEKSVILIFVWTFNSNWLPQMDSTQSSFSQKLSQELNFWLYEYFLDGPLP